MAPPRVLGPILSPRRLARGDLDHPMKSEKNTAKNSDAKQRERSVDGGALTSVRVIL